MHRLIMLSHLYKNGCTNRMGMLKQIHPFSHSLWALALVNGFRCAWFSIFVGLQYILSAPNPSMNLCCVLFCPSISFVAMHRNAERTFSNQKHLLHTEHLNVSEGGHFYLLPMGFLDKERTHKTTVRKDATAVRQHSAVTQ